MCKLIGSILRAMTGSNFVDITPWTGGEWEKAVDELSFLKLGSVLIGLSGGVLNFSGNTT